MCYTSGMTALITGWCYFAGVFAVAFALGTVRTLWLAPLVGAVTAVAIETPIVLAVSWWCSGRLLARQKLGLAGRAVMGGSAFVWLMLAEFGLALAFGRVPCVYLASFATPAGMLGLAGQVAFAAMPMRVKRQGA
jgi:hypothetical protein